MKKIFITLIAILTLTTPVWAQEVNDTVPENGNKQESTDKGKTGGMLCYAKRRAYKAFGKC